MNTNTPPQKGDLDNGLTSEEIIQESMYGDEGNVSDGEEFLDDGIRMKDQPLGETSEKK